jgi:hypothetical protein
MNKTISALAERSGFILWQEEDWNDGSVVDWSCNYDAELQNFYDNIVKEAISVVQKRYMGDQNREDMEVKRCIEDLKNHFGVK